MYGFSAGILSTAINRYVDEYVPAKAFNAVAPIFSFAMNIGTLTATFTAVILPKDQHDTALLEANTSWHYIFGFPIILYLLMITGFLLFVRTDTPKYYLMKGDRQGAESAVKSIYDCKSARDTDAIILHLESHIETTTSSVTTKQAFTDPYYRRCSWVNIGSIIIHELTGINVIFLYSNTILDQVLKHSKSLTPRQGVYIVMSVNTLSSFLAIWSV